MGRNAKKFFKIGLLLCLSAAIDPAVLAQPEVPKTPKPKIVYGPKPPPSSPSPSVYQRGERATSEKSIVVDPNINIKLCVSEGGLKINGWERDEVRVFVRDGRKPSFKVLEKDPKSGKPVWLWVVSSASNEGQSECLAGESVEIDAPIKAVLTLSGRTAGATVDSINKISVKIIEGSISLRNITGGITATTYQGDVMVENSAGSIMLESSTGNIVAFDVSPGLIGDLFKAKTNSGAISLQQVNHRQIEANSISGSLIFNGKFLAGGIYNFKTSNGSVRMSLPPDSSCKIAASYGFGSFTSAFQMKVLTENISPGGKSLIATIGSGDASVTVTTSSGSIGIRKQKP